MDNNSFYKKVENHVKGLFANMNDPTLVFHNLKHTQRVVDRTKEIAGHYHLSEEDMLTVFIAAWFHDTGHLFTEPAKHEDMSVELMRKFMAGHPEENVLTENIALCILSTRMPRNPANLLQQIICDADTYHLGTKDFKDTNKLAMEEHKLKTGQLNKTEFNKTALEMLQTHQFYTTYCKNLLSETKEKNMKKLKKKISEPGMDMDIPVSENTGPAGPANLSELAKDKSGLMSKGIQTMLRLTSENHLKLSDMADNKANILISVNAIIISLILGILSRKLADEPYLTIPSVIFLSVSVTTIIFSILATRPKISEGIFTMQDVKDKKTNLLFFGNFHRASFEEYNVAMREMMIDTDYLYGSLIKDIYHLGTVLGRKYKLIRYAYNIFMVGIIISVLAFAFAVMLNLNSPHATPVIKGSGSPL